MAVSDTPNVQTYRIPMLGEYDLNNRAQKVFEATWAAGTDTAAYVAVAATDSDSLVDFLCDTQETFAAVECGYEPVFVEHVMVRVITAFTASVTHTVGDTDDVDAYLVSANIGSTTAYTGAVNAPARSSDEGGSDEIYKLVDGKFYDGSSSDDSIDIVLGGADPAAGRAVIFVKYFVADNIAYG